MFINNSLRFKILYGMLKGGEGPLKISTVEVWNIDCSMSKKPKSVHVIAE